MASHRALLECYLVALHLLGYYLYGDYRGERPVQLPDSQPNQHDHLPRQMNQSGCNRIELHPVMSHATSKKWREIDHGQIGWVGRARGQDPHPRSVLPGMW